jgi:hypothetical protein
VPIPKLLSLTRDAPEGNQKGAGIVDLAVVVARAEVVAEQPGVVDRAVVLDRATQVDEKGVEAGVVDPAIVVERCACPVEQALVGRSV